MPLRPLLLLVGCAIAAGGCSTTGQTGPGPDTAAEHAGSDAAWTNIDPDQDGFLTVAELESQHAVALLRDLWQADTDNDGRVSRQEWNLWWPRTSRTPASPTMQALNASAAVPGSPATD